MSDGDNKPRLMEVAQRIFKLEKERAEVDEIIKDVYSEAKNMGYDTKVLKRAIKFVSLEVKDQKRVRSEQDMFDLYVSQLDFSF